MTTHGTVKEIMPMTMSTVASKCAHMAHAIFRKQGWQYGTEDGHGKIHPTSEYLATVIYHLLDKAQDSGRVESGRFMVEVDDEGYRVYLRLENHLWSDDD